MIFPEAVLITKDILRDIGIVAVGDILLIMRHAKKVG